MKKHYFMMAAAALMLASCSNEGLVDPVQDQAASTQTPMQFKFRAQNETRANLETETQDFSVWAAKANGWTDLLGTNMTFNADANIPNLVMNNYLVGHTSKYTAPAEQDLFGSAWFYEGLGSANGSKHAKQYLKYWDGSYSYTFFLACAPYNPNAVVSMDGTIPAEALTNGGAKAPKLNFGSISMSTEPWAYAATCEINADHLKRDGATPAQPIPVGLKFHRVTSGLEIAVYEDIPGYKVEILDINYDDGNKHGIAAFPAKRAEDMTTNFGHRYSEGAIVESCTPSVVVDIYNSTNFNDPIFYSNIDVATADKKTTPFDFAIPTTNLTAFKGHKVVSENNAADKVSMSPTVYHVIPNADMGEAYKNSGLQFVMNFRLIAEDTGEEIIVRNARAYVTDNWTQWSPNTRYRYVFKITKNASGTTTPTDTPYTIDDPADALYPIVFNNVTITDLETGATTEHEVTYNGYPAE